MNCLRRIEDASKLLSIAMVLLISQAFTFSLVAAENNDNRWKQYLQSADEAKDHGSPELAATLYGRALAIAERFAEHDPRLAVTLHKIGSFYVYRKPSLASFYLRRSIALMETLPREQVLDLDLATENGLLCESLLIQRKIADAEICAKKKLALQESLLHADDPALVDSLKCVGDCEVRQLHWAEALPYFKRASEIARAQRLASLGIILLVVARNEVYAEQFSQGKDHKQQAFQYKNKCVQTEFADNLRELGVAYMRKNMGTEATDCYDEAAHILASVHKEDSPIMAKLIANRGRLCYRQGQYANAEVIHRKALALTAALKLKATDPLVKLVTEFLADDLEKEGKTVEASKLRQWLKAAQADKPK